MGGGSWLGQTGRTVLGQRVERIQEVESFLQGIKTMSFTAVPNTPAINLPPTGPGGPQSFNPVFVQCDPANGNYFQATGRDLVTFYLFAAEEFAPAWLATSNYTVGSVVNFAGEIDSITSVQENAGFVLTVTATNTFTVGAQVKLTGLTGVGNTFLNGLTLIVTSSTGTTFTALDPTDKGTYGPVAESTGIATNPAGIFISIAASGTQFPGGPKQPNTPAYWAAYVDADAELFVASAPDACTGRTSNIGVLSPSNMIPGTFVSGYNVPAPVIQGSTPPVGVVTVEFLVLPSSVFTQA